jgi:hypothetical protein
MQLGDSIHLVRVSRFCAGRAMTSARESEKSLPNVEDVYVRFDLR